MADASPDDASNKAHESNGRPAKAQDDSPSPDRPARFSQYAEAIENPLPQIAVESVPEPISNLDQLDCDDAASTHPVVQPDDPVDRRSSAVVYAGEKPSRWRKYRTPIIVGLIIAVIILTGTVVGVVVSNHNRGGSGGGGASTSSSSAPASGSATSSTGGSSTTPSSTTSAAGSPVRSDVTTPVSSSSTPSPTQSSSRSPTQSSTPSQCADTSKYLTSVSFMSIVGGNGYNVEYYATNDAAACCAYCYTQVPDGCDSWSWTGGFIGTACSMITGWKGSNSDKSCPQGHTAVNFQQTANNASHVGGVGPCATLAST